MKELKRYLAPLLLFASGFSYYYYLQFRNPLLYGVDGAFYAGEAKCILLSGHPCLVEPRLPLYIPALFALAGLDFSSAVKASLVLFTSITVIPFYLLSSRVLGNRLYAVLTSIAYMFNPFTMRLGVEFLKNVVGVFFLAIWFYYFYVVFVEEHRDKHVYLYITTLLVASSHILVYGLLVLFTVSALIYSLMFNRKHVGRLSILTAYVLFLVVLGFTTPVFGWQSYLRDIQQKSWQITVLKNVNYTIQDIVLPAISVAILVYVLLSRRTGKEIIIAPLLVLEALAFIPLPVFAGLSWRIMLMFSVYLPLSMILFNGAPVRRAKTILLFGITILSLVFSIMVSVHYYRPLISADIIDEMKEVLPHYTSENFVIIVPDKVLRHWVFYIVAPHKVFDSLHTALSYTSRIEAGRHNHVFIEILYSPDPEIGPPPPSTQHVLLYRGKYIYIYEIEM